MKKVNQTILKRRWYIFALLGFLIFLMNFFLWYEATLVIRSHPYLKQLEHKASDTDYALVYTPNSRTDHFIVTNSKAEKTAVLDILTETFYDKQASHQLYQNKQAYLTGTSPQTSLRQLRALPLSELKTTLSDDFVNLEFFENLMVRDATSQQLQGVEAALKKQNFQLDFVSFSEQYATEKNYYLKNFYFAVASASLILVLTGLVAVWILKDSLRLLHAEMFQFRVLGLSLRQIQENFFRLFASIHLMILSCFSAFAYLIGLGFIWQDIGLLLLINGFLVAFYTIAIQRHLRRTLYA